MLARVERGRNAVLRGETQCHIEGTGTDTLTDYSTTSNSVRPTS
jgi:hypothetical protein